MVSSSSLRIRLAARATIASLFALLLAVSPLAVTRDSAGAATFPAQQARALRAKALPLVGYAKPGQRVELMIHLPLRNKAEASSLAMQLATPRTANFHHWLTPEEFLQRFAPRTADINSVSIALRAAGFSVGKTDPQFIHATAPASTVERFFDTKMGIVRDGTIERFDARTPLSVPASLTHFGATVIGLNATQGPHRDVRFQPASSQGISALKRAHLAPNVFFYPGNYLPGELLQAYGEPSYLFAKGNGIHIATLEFSGTTDSDAQYLWCLYGLGPSGCGTQLGTGGPSVPYPTVNHITTLGAYPPGSLESSYPLFDEELIGGSAPGAILDEYAADAVGNFGFLDMLSHIVNANRDDIVSAAYDSCELNFIDGAIPMYYLLAFDDIVLQGTLQGQTFLFPSGVTGAYGCYYEDFGSTALSTNAYSSDPNVTAVGGTTNLATTNTDGGYGTIYAAETSYSNTKLIEYASGGGVSQIFATPGYQLAIGLPAGTTVAGGAPFGSGRQNPDISMHMGGPMYGDDTVFLFCSTVNTGVPPPGCLTYAFGTGATVMQFAGWLAEATTSVNAGLGNPGGFRLGNVNNIFYYIQAVGGGPIAYNQNIPGDNLYTTYNPANGLGYNQVIGLGTPNLAKLYGFLGLSATPYQAAGDTFTPSNP